MISKVTQLNLNDQDAMVKYEKTLYRAFSDSDIQSLDLIWNMDHKARRIRTKVPYTNQEVFVLTFVGGTRFQAGLAVNFGMENRLQLEMTGFKIGGSREHLCEALYLFSLADSRMGEMILNALGKSVFDRMRQKGIKVVYGTCSEKRLRQYMGIGFDKVDERELKGERKYLLRMDVPQTFVPRKRLQLESQ